MQSLAVFVGRILLAIIFVVAGVEKIFGYAGTQVYMQHFGVPGQLLPLVILVELGGAILIVLGLLTRLASLALAGFCILAAVIFHHDFSQETASIMFMKDVAIAGGFLVVAAHGAGGWSVDAMLSGRRG